MDSMIIFEKNTIKKNYRFFMIALLMTMFILLMFYTSVPAVNHFSHQLIQIVNLCALTLLAFILPLILWDDLYHKTNINHLSSLPLTRTEYFLANYILGLVFSVLLIVTYTSFSTLIKGGYASWVGETANYLVIFVFYYHLALLAYYISGNKFFYAFLFIVFIGFTPMAILVHEALMGNFCQGYVSSDLIYDTVLFSTPLAQAIKEVFVHTDLYRFNIYVIIGFSLLLPTYFAVKYRKNELVGETINFKWIGYILRVLISLLLSSGIFCILCLDTKLKGFEGCLIYLLTYLIVIYIVEMLFRKKAKVFYILKYGFVLGLICYYGVIETGIKANIHYVPAHYQYMTVENDQYYNLSYLIKEYYPQLLDVITVPKDLEESFKDLHLTLSNTEGVVVGDFGISFKYYDESGKCILAREYQIDEDLLENGFISKIAEEKQQLSEEMFDMLLTSEKVIMNIDDSFVYMNYGYSLESETYVEERYEVNTPELQYKFKQNLKLEIEAAKKNQKAYFEAYKDMNSCDLSFAYANNQYIGFTCKSPIIKAAIEKTFNN